MRSLTPFLTPFHQAAPLPTFRIITLLITILCTLFAIPSSAQPTPYYKLVTSSDELVAGYKYIICYNDKLSEFVSIMKTYVSDEYYCRKVDTHRATTTFDDKIPAPAGSSIITLEADGDKWRLKTEDGQYYSFMRLEDRLATTPNKSDYSIYNIVIDPTDSHVVITCPNKPGYTLQYSNEKFASYNTTKSPVYLYRYYSDYYTREKGYYNYATICLPTVATDLSHTFGTFYTIAGKTMENNELTAIVIEETSSLEAGKGYIFKYNEGAQIVAVEHKGETTDIVTENKGMIGNLSKEAKNVPIGYYILKSDKILKNAASHNVTIGQYRAYIDLTHVPVFTGTLSSKMVRFDINDETTHISAINPGNSSKPQKTFNTQGTLVDESYKGIIIYGGKKILRK
ncbi:MAG: hypothetical protein SPJ79_04025 [Prevotella sp.]|nr:hypothetical protein [Bacteroidales bacterium]MDY5876737.1 hypothetical protein [Prevotella sp.]